MSRSQVVLLFWLTVPYLSGDGAPRASASEDVAFPEERFENQIRPVLLATCFPCHGGEKTSAGLRVDSREAMLRGGDGGPAIVPGRPEVSPAVRAIEYADAELKMPPARRLDEEAVRASREWVKAGAPWPHGRRAAAKTPETHPERPWAFRPIKAAEPPADPSGWSISPIDRFVAAGHRAEGVRPVRSVDKRTLIRRVTFDLIGLPPTPGEIAAFLSDSSPDSYARLIDRLLASPHYGERWGRHWMDVAHYADPAGDNADYPVPELVRYRDYIIASFNADKPYNEFVREQLAGDVLARQSSPEAAEGKVVATGFLALARRYGTGPYELWHLSLEDLLETTGRAFLGLTLRCARCHDHKYDPVTQRDYYALYGICASTTFAYAGSEEFVSKRFPRSNSVPLGDGVERKSSIDQNTARVAELGREIARLEKASSDPPERARREPEKPLGPLRRELERRRRSDLPPDAPCAYAVAEGRPVDAAVQRAGEPSRPGPVVPRGVPRFEFLGMAPPRAVAGESSGRLELAEWLTRADHPLTARVMTNRVWQYHFGRGLVATPSNFGVRGEPPSHPELLDWLAARLIHSGWSVKDLHRQILLSQTYRTSCDLDERNAERDPGNRRLWRFERRRLDAEAIRDGMLAVSGGLDLRKPGRHPFPPIESWAWTQHNAFKDVYPSNSRSVYLMTQRLIKHPYLAVFDGLDTNTSTDVRARSTVPLQALFLMNNPFVDEQARAFATRLIDHAADRDDRLRTAWELAWGRLPTDEESERARLYLAAYARALGSGKERDPDFDRDVWTGLTRLLLASNEFLYVEQHGANRSRPSTRRVGPRSDANMHGFYGQSAPTGRRAFLGSLATAATADAAGHARLVRAADLGGAVALAPRATHHAPKAKQLIVVFLTGGFSAVDTFDHKPKLTRDHGKPVPSFGLRADETSNRPLLGSPFRFRPRGDSGLTISELFPHLGELADDLCVIRSLHTDIVEHFQAVLAMHTGSATVPLPSLGAWISYGLGTFDPNLPSHVVLCENLPYAGSRVWDNGFLPPIHQGVRIIPGPSPVPDLAPPPRSVALRELEHLMLRDLNEAHAGARPGDSDLEARIASFEIARGMMHEAPEVLDFRTEDPETLSLYGVAEVGEASFGAQCLIARRLIEHGVRVVEIIDTGSSDNWDAHGDMKNHRPKARRVDRAISALIKDLKRRGFLDETLIAICTEFGRTPWTDGPGAKGRNHFAKAFSSLLVGAGVRGGGTHGETDDYGMEIVADPIHVHDYHATILHLMGLDHTRLVYRYAGRDFRLTDVDGDVVRQILV